MGPADAARARYKLGRDASLAAVSDRTRTMCVGALVLIWGVFSEKGDVKLSLSPRRTDWLLAVGLGAIIVLALDVVEFLFAYQSSRQALEGEHMKPKDFPYERCQKACLGAKLFIGAGTLVTLCVVLLLVLTRPVKAQDSSMPADNFYGEWCGGDANASQFICLSIGAPYGSLYVQYNESGEENWTVCENPSIDGATLDVSCREIRFDVSREDEYLDSTATYSDGGVIKRTLRKQD
jgi:hypothetical protein